MAEAILDAGYICHIGFVADGQPYAIPTAYARDGGDLLIHGSAASRMARTLAAGAPACVTVTHLDGLVFARSSFNNSMNYRSVVVLGVAELVDDPDAKLRALRVLTERLMPGRWEQARPPSASEFKATSVLRLPITEFSCKVRTGPPVDDEEDYARPIWAGVIPLMLSPGPAVPDARLGPEAAGALPRLK